jgi:aspartyl-tRNA synthetase
MSFAEAMNRYGSDKPDTRFEVFLQDISEVFKSQSPACFARWSNPGRRFARWSRPRCAYSRKVLDDLTAFVKQLGAAGLAWIKTGEEGMTAAPVVKNAGAATMAEVLKKTALLQAIPFS